MEFVALTGMTRMPATIATKAMTTTVLTQGRRYHARGLTGYR